VTVKYRDGAGEPTERTFSKEVHGAHFPKLADEFKATNARRSLSSPLGSSLRRGPHKCHSTLPAPRGITFFFRDGLLAPWMSQLAYETADEGKVGEIIDGWHIKRLAVSGSRGRQAFFLRSFRALWPPNAVEPRS
jgi:hypothetical protein